MEAAVTSAQLRALRRLIAKLKSAQEIACTLELTLGNGAEVDSLLGSLADELELKLATE